MKHQNISTTYRRAYNPYTRIEWTPEMDEMLRRGVANDELLDIIAAEIGVAPNTARKRLNQLGIARRSHRYRQPSKIQKPEPIGPVIPRELLFAELLSQGYQTDQAGWLAGYTNGNAQLQRIRKKLGDQAV
jgi:hypothetical protein